MRFGAPRRERGGFRFPIAFTATVLSWAILEHGDQMKAVKQMDHAHDYLKWIIGYLINEHPSPNVPFVEADYVPSKNPMRMSNLVVYESRYPQYVHHRGVSIPVDAETGCRNEFKWLDSPNPNLNAAVGALVGGSLRNKTYIDSRNNPIQGEPSTYNSALIVALLSGLVTTSPVGKTF